MTGSESLFFLHVLQLHRDYQAEMMRRLATAGHGDLRLGFQPVIRHLAAGEIRPTNLAEQLGMQKQNCAQLLNKVEAAGYIERVADSRDRRARLVCLTGAGRQLVRDGTAVTRAIDAELATVVGERDFRQFRETLQQLAAPRLAEPGMGNPADTATPGVFIRDLIELAKFCSVELNQRVRARGYSAVRPAHEQVLIHLGESGARIQTLARANDVSRQAISALVLELQALGYVSLETDPQDARGRVIHLTTAGRTLLRDSAAVAGQLLTEFQGRVGEHAFTRLRHTLASLHDYLASGAPAVERERPGEGTARYLLTMVNANTEELPALGSAELENAANRIRDRLGRKDFERLNGLLGQLAEA